MGPEMILCNLLSISPGLRLLSSSLLLLHLLLLLIPILTPWGVWDNVRNIVNFAENVFCSSSTPDTSILDPASSSCSKLQTFGIRLLFLPYVELLNMLLLVSHVFVVVFTSSSKIVLLHSLLLQLLVVLQLSALGVFLTLQFPSSPHGPLLLLFQLPLAWTLLVRAGKSLDTLGKWDFV